MNKKLLTRMIIITMSFMITNVQAYSVNNFADKGIYIVGQAGSGCTESGFLDELFGGMEMHHNQGFAGRLGVGCQLYRYVGLEVGLASYPSAIRNYNSSRALFGSGNHSGNSKISDIYSADFMAMLRLPIGNYLFISAGGGVAFMHFKYGAMRVTRGGDVVFEYGAIQVKEGYETIMSWQPGSKYFFAPKIALRIGAKINQKITVFLSDSYILSTNGDGGPSRRDYQPGLNLVAVGLSYSFL